MQPRIGRSFLLSVFASCAISCRSHAKYGTLAAAVTAALVARNRRRDERLRDMNRPFGRKIKEANDPNGSFEVWRGTKGQSNGAVGQLPATAGHQKSVP